MQVWQLPENTISFQFDTRLVWKPLTIMHKTLIIQMPRSLVVRRQEEKERRIKNKNGMCASTAMELLPDFFSLA